MKSYTSTMLQILKIDRSPHNEDFHPYTTRNATPPPPQNEDLHPYTTEDIYNLLSPLQ